MKKTAKKLGSSRDIRMDYMKFEQKVQPSLFKKRENDSEFSRFVKI